MPTHVKVKFAAPLLFCRQQYNYIWNSIMAFKFDYQLHMIAAILACRITFAIKFLECRYDICLEFKKKKNSILSCRKEREWMMKR